MAKKIKGAGIELRAKSRREDSRREKIDIFQSIDHIKKLAEHNANADLDTIESLETFLASWWSRKYNRPLKDPLLASYTLEELLYEFHNHIERAKAAEKQLEQEGDRIEDEVKQANLDWAEQEELKELEQLKSMAAAQEKKDDEKPHKPTKEDIEWMEQKMKEAKEVYGDSFGEDIEEDFE